MPNPTPHPEATRLARDIERFAAVRGRDLDREEHQSFREGRDARLGATCPFADDVLTADLAAAWGAGYAITRAAAQRTEPDLTRFLGA